MSNDNGYVAISKASPSVINISSHKNIENRLFDGSPEKSVVGSGIVISNDGYIITNMHVIEGKDLSVELDDGQVYPAS